MGTSFLIRGVVGLALCVGLAACDKGREGAPSNATVNVEAEENAIEETEKALLQALRLRDAAAVTSVYADNARLVFSGQAPISGGDAIRTWSEDMLKDPNFSIDFTNEGTDVAGSGELAYSRGVYTVTYTHPETKQKATEKGNYLTIFEKGRDGRWKIREDMSVAGPQNQS